MFRLHYFFLALQLSFEIHVKKIHCYVFALPVSSIILRSLFPLSCLCAIVWFVDPLCPYVHVQTRTRFVCAFFSFKLDLTYSPWRSLSLAHNSGLTVLFFCFSHQLLIIRSLYEN